MDYNPHACGCRSGTSSAACQCVWTKQTRATWSPEYFRGCRRALHTSSEAMKDITERSATLKPADASLRKRNVARMLFPQRIVQANEGYAVSRGHVHSNYVHEQSICIDKPKINSITTSSTDNTATNCHASANHLSTPAKTMAYPTSWASDKGWEIDYDSADETVYLADITADDHELEGCWTGYEEELFQIERDRKKGASNADGFLFDNGPDNRMVMRLGQRFEDDFQFRRAIEVLAIRDGIKLCIMHNSSTCVSCECSDLDCDWKLTGVKEHTSNVFVISNLTPEHMCKKRWLKLQWGTKWIAAKFLHIWKVNVGQEISVLANEIAATYGMQCPLWKLNAVDSTATKWLRTDHAHGYAQLLQYKHEMEDINDRNIVIIETTTDDPLRPEVFKRMFVFLYDTAYAFKTRCRTLITIDGWEIDGPYKSVMLVAVCRDGNDVVLPIAFCEVQEENLDSWAFFLKNLTYGLRFERGEGLCILADGDNGVDEVVEEFLPYAVYRQCCFSLYGRMVVKFPDVQLHSAFWGACRSTDRKSFIHHMSIIETVNIECHNWLKDTDSKTWALFSMPQWVKSTEVTKSSSEQLRIWLSKFLDLNVAQRYTTITRTIAEMFQRRYLAGWEWVYDKITPAARQQIIHNVFESDGWNVDMPSNNAVSFVSRHGFVFEVNRELMTCSCRLWQLSGIPCEHACRCIHSWGDKLDKYVHRLWSVDEYRSAYGPGMQMLREITHWEWQTKDNVLPPMKNSTNSSASNEANCHSKAFRCGLTRRRSIRASGLPYVCPHGHR
ncbi:hypothetical protein WN944_014640 [Citrus x changshan-huyou]|uniref:SWIM-type domain-containing protein n=1 Tax=Citrus x changshan-huyou TaxID=2935761 RepID=A0AAP0M643_9ROSI